ncbi:hypothetical protein NDR89_20525 [Cupriavidus gilardii]|uniref:Uncharacterized protein n=1 Tax=Cupriavidus gilardii TaxID=82541 RepID=A0ABY4VPV8_9BURK|nr:hypothetical protein [Cupriavidus gilardii]USE79025.1 hypothetical protein NDR89_20525 [Cupriavidus gilardii]
MSNENMQFPIPNSILEPYIKAAVATAITASLGDGTALVEKAVHQALTAKVNASGFTSNSSYENTHLLAEVVSRNAIQKIARETIAEMAEQMRPKIREQIEKQLKNQHGKLAQALVDGLIGSLRSSWSVQIHIDTTK